jgi:hypothetical protein
MTFCYRKRINFIALQGLFTKGGDYEGVASVEKSLYTTVVRNSCPLK